ncbi:MAG: ribosome maturation factor RimM [Candidatus Desulfofervidaceae bacterium]|nr:ribosome maturation factor RimM [Candidatus Desulfofervidaceae bacterium]
MQETELLLIGKVVNTHGIKGELRVVPYTKSVESFRAAGVVYVKFKSGPFQPYHIVSVRPHKNVYIVGLSEVNHISQVEALIGAEIYREKSSLPGLDEEKEYYWYQVIGLEVRSLKGEVIGKIKHVFNTGSNDIFVVYDEKNKKEYLIPSIDDVVERFDFEAGILWINVIPNLLEQ